MSMNRHNQTSTPCSTSTPNDLDPPDTTRKDIWPRFLIMEAADENIPLDMDEFVLKKQLMVWRMEFQKRERLEISSHFHHC